LSIQRPAILNLKFILLLIHDGRPTPIEGHAFGEMHLHVIGQLGDSDIFSASLRADHVRFICVIDGG